ncbi:MAG: methyltransferase domain-containing protein [bacterium]
MGNSGLDAPAHTGVIDYFFNTASPLQPEDGGGHTLTVIAIGDGIVHRNPDRPVYGPGEIVNLTATPVAGLRFHGWSGDQSGSDNPFALTMDKDQIIMAMFTAGDDPVIDLWYGPEQIFGHLGAPQRWINVLGNVSDYDGIASLSYSLNGGPPLQLSIGPGNPRLVTAGDFNVELACKDLVSGQNQVVLTATDRLGNTVAKAVNAELRHGAVWPLPNVVEWNSGTGIQQVAQIVDGKWAVEASRLRTKAVGYDRLIAIGDTIWKDYEVTVPITIHGFDMRSTGAVVGILMRWEGHYDWGGNKPLEGWWPMGAMGVYQPRNANNSSGYLRIVGDWSVDLVQAVDRQLALGVPYIFKMRVETTPGQGGLYRLKVWPEGAPEPSTWDLIAQEGASDPAHESLLLVAHNTDASFGKVTVTPATNVASSMFSDYFNSGKLNTSVWKFIDPAGDATLAMTQEEIAITVPAGAAHDVWTNENLAPRIMQAANDTDFEIEVKFTSPVSNGFQMLGVLIEESRANFLRFDFHHNGSGPRIFAATFVDGIATTKINNGIRQVVPLYMRVKREGDRWTQSYSFFKSFRDDRGRSGGIDGGRAYRRSPYNPMECKRVSYRRLFLPFVRRALGSNGTAGCDQKTSAHEMKNLCPSCGTAGMSPFYTVKGVPVHSVLLMRTREIAMNYPKGDLILGFCPQCAFISNLAFDPGRHEYSSNYEETQGFSPTFNAFHRQLAAHLIERYELHDKTVIEIGCGKGEFLSLLCELGGNRGVGFDPAYVSERNPSTANDGLTFIKDFYSEAYDASQGDLICCKMTLEHIQPVAEFVRTVRRTTGNRRETIVFFQVPNISCILRDLAFWDLYYEHCSYFSPGSLARLMRNCGFEILDLWKNYNDQYVMIEARPHESKPRPFLPQEDDLVELTRAVAHFAENHTNRLKAWKRDLQTLQREGRRVVLWGGGSKAVAFLTTLGIQEEIEYVVDINPYKRGTFMAGSGQRIVAPAFLRDYRPDTVIVMNPIYRNEIQQALNSMGLCPEVKTV